MTHRVTLAAAALSILLAGSTATSQDWRTMLPEEQEAGLPPAALIFYEEAVVQNDRVNYDEAVMLLAEAAAAAPNHIPLQFLVSSRARNRAEMYYSQNSFTQPPSGMESYTSPPWRTAEPFYEMAQDALDRLQVNPGLSTEDRERLERELNMLNSGMANLAERDRQREEAGANLVTSIRDARIQARGLEDQDFDKLDPRNVLLRRADEQVEDDYLRELGLEDTTEDVNPFGLLPGEYVAPFLPPPPPPPQMQQQRQQQMMMDPFAAEQAMGMGGEFEYMGGPPPGPGGQDMGGRPPAGMFDEGMK